MTRKRPGRFVVRGELRGPGVSLVFLPTTVVPRSISPVVSVTRLCVWLCLLVYVSSPLFLFLSPRQDYPPGGAGVGRTGYVRRCLGPGRRSGCRDGSGRRGDVERVSVRRRVFPRSPTHCLRFQVRDSGQDFHEGPVEDGTARLK